MIFTLCWNPALGWTVLTCKPPRELSLVIFLAASWQALAVPLVLTECSASKGTSIKKSPPSPVRERVGKAFESGTVVANYLRSKVWSKSWTVKRSLERLAFPYLRINRTILLGTQLIFCHKNMVLLVTFSRMQNVSCLMGWFKCFRKSLNIVDLFPWE